MKPLSPSARTPSERRSTVRVPSPEDYLETDGFPVDLNHYDRARPWYTFIFGHLKPSLNIRLAGAARA